MGTYHWINAGYTLGFSPWQVLSPDLTLNVPAGSTLKRFVLHNTNIGAFTTGLNVNQVCSLWVQYDLTISAGQYAGRRIFLTTRAVPHQVVGFHDVLTAARVYTVSAQGGDNELGFNQRCSYGTADGPGFTVRLQTLIGNYPIGFGFPPGSASAVLSLLYYTP